MHDNNMCMFCMYTYVDFVDVTLKMVEYIDIQRCARTSGFGENTMRMATRLHENSQQPSDEWATEATKTSGSSDARLRRRRRVCVNTRMSTPVRHADRITLTRDSSLLSSSSVRVRKESERKSAEHKREHKPVSVSGMLRTCWSVCGCGCASWLPSRCRCFPNGYFNFRGLFKLLKTLRS